MEMHIGRDDGYRKTVETGAHGYGTDGDARTGMNQSIALTVAVRVAGAGSLRPSVSPGFYFFMIVD